MKELAPCALAKTPIAFQIRIFIDGGEGPAPCGGSGIASRNRVIDSFLSAGRECIFIVG